MWEIERHEDVEKRFKKFRKKWKRELKNVFDNLDTYLKALQRGIDPEQLKREYSFVHGNYKFGIVSIDQSGPREGRGKLKPFRLYLFPSIQDEVLHLRTLGDKESQDRDVKTTEKFVEGLLTGLSSKEKESRGDADGGEQDNDSEEGN